MILLPNQALQRMAVTLAALTREKSLAPPLS